MGPHGCHHVETFKQQNSLDTYTFLYRSLVEGRDQSDPELLKWVR